MIFNILKFIDKELRRSIDNNADAPLSVLHFDMHKWNMQRALLFVFEKNNTFPKYIVKYPKNDLYKKMLYLEFEKYRSIYKSLSAILKCHLPNPICVYNNGSEMATIEAAVPGQNIASFLKNKPNSKKNLHLLYKSLEFIFDFQTETAKSCSFNEQLLDLNIDRPLRCFAEKFNLSSRENKNLTAIRNNIADYLKTKALLVSCHGDYWVNNVMSYNEKIYVVDWANCLKEYLPFWDYYSFIYTVNINNKKIANEFEEISSFFLRKNDIYPDVENDIKILFFAIRSVWNKYVLGVESKWDTAWKSKFDEEMNKRTV